MKRFLLTALATSFLAMGCAPTQTVATSDRADEGDVVTGSRIPRKTRDGAEGTKIMSGAGYKQEQIGRGNVDGIGPKIGN